MLVEGASPSTSSHPPSARQQIQNPSNFARGEKASVSVRLRRKKNEVGRRLAAASRHSGDFSFLGGSGGGGSSMGERRDAADADEVDGGGSSGGGGGGGDWAYITFPNGVPTVQDLRTNRQPPAAAAPLQQPPASVANPSNRKPVKVVTREVPGLTNNSNLGRLFSASSTNIDNQSPRGGFTSRGRPMSTANGDLRRNSRSAATILEERSSSSSSPAASERRNHFRRRSEQPQSRPLAAAGAPAAKRCSGEFHFEPRRRSPVAATEVPAQRDSSAASSPSGSPRTPQQKEVELRPQRQAGLGRRAATQVQIEQKRKNSYNAAVYRSQENLVKACVMNDEASLEKASSTLKKGLLWAQRDKLFSRWKERYFVLTKDYLNCFKKGTSRVSEMGEFLYKVKICDADEVDILDKRGYLTICISLPKDGKIYLRKTDGIREWHKLLKDCHREASKRRKNDLDTEGFWSRKQATDSSSIENWLQSRKKKGLLSPFSDSTPDINKSYSSGDNSSSPSKQPEITLKELSKLYQDAGEGDDAALPPPIVQSPNLSPVTQLISEKDAHSPVVAVRMRKTSREERAARRPKIINRLSLMSDIELPDFGHHHNIDLEKGIFAKKTTPPPAPKALLDSQSNDSGNHSMSTNASLASSSSSKSKDSNEDPLPTQPEDPDILHRTVIEVRHRDGSASDRHGVSNGDKLRHRRSSYMPGVQVTHV